MSGEFLNRTKKIIGLWCLLFLSISAAIAQEVNATVQVVAPRVQLSNKEILNTLQNSIQQFMNNRKWSEEKVAIEEKINFSLFININAINNDQFVGTAQLQVTRPVYNSSYKTTVMQFNDEDISFAYREFENLDYQENMNMNDLTTLLAYYVYIAMGVEFDSFGELGGSLFFSKAQAIVNIMTNKPGWNQVDGRGFRNRFYLADNFNSPRFKDFRKLNYQYHREGMDQFHEDPLAAREQITSSLKLIAETSQSNRNSLLQKLFFTTKWPELVEIYKGATTAEKTIIVRLLNELDPTNAQRYEKIKS